MAADHLFELDADMLALATELEGHPDNVAAALHGGFVICADGEATRFEPPTGLEAVVVVPGAAVRTKTARAALPAQVPIADAVFNTAHGALLVLGLARGDWDLVARGLDDRLHQPRREHLYPRSMELVRARALARRAGGDDLGRRPDRARVVPLRGHRRASSRRCAARPRAGRRSCACPSSPRARTCASSRRAVDAAPAGARARRSSPRRPSSSSARRT